jgi:hypothetical protein
MKNLHMLIKGLRDFMQFEFTLEKTCNLIHVASNVLFAYHVNCINTIKKYITETCI